MCAYDGTEWILTVFFCCLISEVQEHWVTAGTLADMRMTAATATLLRCQADDFDRLQDLWTGPLAPTLVYISPLCDLAESKFEIYGVCNCDPQKFLTIVFTFVQNQEHG